MKFNNNENFNICSLCKGQCCKRMPGIVHPNQLQQPITKELLLKLYKEGYQFDYWEGDEYGNLRGRTGYFLRPQTLKSKGVLVDPSWGGTCVFLTEQGCSKIFEERPYMCQQLKPSENFNCGPSEDNLKKYDYVLAWLEYNDLIEEIINENNNSNSIENLEDW